ncbi:beta strand repeat-containing protein [Spirosoma validum]|uniref:DUF6923 domain-containing protein n=1 Tax=Spirosoma validum TaxID=2771355 RepID=A0A927GH61_9BACT|nr:hypothetical protein [Spirosoma validum]MBD2757418.1 hypothetical protein [Spirosoma validum]
MIKSYNPPPRWQWVWMSIPVLLVLLVMALSARAQQGSQGNTTIFSGAQMTLFGNHNFLTGGAGTQPGIIGTVRSAPFGVLNFAATATGHTGANDANHVDGYVRKQGAGSFIFPTGDNGHYGPFAAAADGTTGAYIYANPSTAVTSNLGGGNYAALPAGAPFSTSAKAANLSVVSTQEYWDIDGTNNTAITLTWSALSAIGTLTTNDLSKLTIVGWNGTQWVPIASAVDVTSVLGGTSNLTAGSITTTGALAPNAYTAYTFGATAALAPFACSSLAYQVAATGGGAPSTLYSFNVATGVRTVIKQDLGRTLNGIGYNTVDNLIWGWDGGAHEVVRIDATGAITGFTIPDLPAINYNIGDVLNGGYLFLYNTDGATYYVVDINPARSSTYLKLVDPTIGYVLDASPYGTTITPTLTISDWAYNPSTGNFYGLTAANDATPFRITTLNPVTGVATVGTAAVSGGTIGTETSGFGASFVDNSGNLFVFGNQSGKFFKVNLSSRVATLVSTSSPSGNNDGASCNLANLLPPTPFACVSKTYQVAVPTGQTFSSLYEFDVNTGSRNTLATLTRTINAIGYSTVDNYIWGFDNNLNQVVRIDANGSILGYTIPNLPNLNFINGDVMTGGYLFLYTSGGTRYYVVDINPAHTATYLQLVDPTTGFTVDNTPFGTPITAYTISDWAYDPVTNKFYGLTNTAAADPFKVVTLDPLTGATTLAAAGVSGGGIRQETSAFGATYIDNTGNLFVYANTLDVFFRINMATNVATQLAVTGVPLAGNDGASCPLVNLITPPTPFACTSTAYQVAVPTGSGLTTSVLYAFDVNSGVRTVLDTLTRNINAIGYNTADNLIWGYDNSANRVVRIDGNRVTTAFLIQNLPTTQNYVVGDVLNGGYLFLLGVTDKKYYVVDLGPIRSTYLDLVDPLTGYTADASPFGTTIPDRVISDWAYDPATSRFYALTNPGDANPYQVVILNPTTGSTTLTTGQVTGGGIRGETSGYGATFVDNTGSLYVYANTLDEFFKINIAAKTAVKLSSADLPLGGNDGASCNLTSLTVPPVSFSCTATAYQVAIPNGQTNSTLYGFNVGTGTRTTVAALNRPINAIGYSPMDNLIWGYDNAANRVVRIDGAGTVTAFNIPNLPTNLNYAVGDVMNGGYLFLLNGATYYVVDIDPSRAATYLNLVESANNSTVDAAPFGTAITNYTLSDWAYNPATNRFYGLTNPGNANSFKVVTMNPANGSTTLSTGTVSGGGIQTETSAYGAAFVDNTGSLYVYANTLDRFFRVDLATNSATILGTTGTPLGGNDGASCATATLVTLPDLTPIVYARPSTVYGTTAMSVVVDVVEVLGVPTSGTIVVRVTKDSKVNLTFDPGATTINGRTVQNSLWTYDAVSDVNYYILRTSSIIFAGDKLSFGFTGTLAPGMTTGIITMSSVISGGSGGEVRVNNNSDADKIDYFQQ